MAVAAISPVATNVRKGTELRLALAPVDQLAEDEAHAGEEQDRVEEGGDDPPAPGAAVLM